VPDHDPIHLRERLRGADRQERLDAPLRADRLDPHVLALIDEREAEPDPLRPGHAQLAPDAWRPLPGRLRAAGERDPVEVEQEHPPAHHVGEGGRDPRHPGAVHHRAGEDVLRVDGPLEHVVLLGEQPGEHGLGDRDERHRVGDLEHREPEPVGRRRQRPRQAIEAEPEPHTQAGEARFGEPLHVRALFRGVRPDPGARGEQELAALQPRRGVLELAEMDPPDGPIRPRLSRTQTERESRDGEDVSDREGHDAIVRVVQPRAAATAGGVRDWTGSTTRRSAVGRPTA
jgi:hypothetical protein